MEQKALQLLQMFLKQYTMLHKLLFYHYHFQISKNDDDFFEYTSY